MKNKLQISFIIIFCILIVLPLAGMPFNFSNDFDLNENRKLSPLPELHMTRESIEAFPSAFESFFNDHFGFRNPLIIAGKYAQVILLGVSTNAQIVLGKDGWLFYNPNLIQFHFFDPYQGAYALRMKKDIDQRVLWFKDHGIAYFLTIVPEKETIYPEFLADETRKFYTLNYYEESEDFFKQYPDVFIDLKKPIMEAKDAYEADTSSTTASSSATFMPPLYYRTDSHWAPPLGFIGYQNIMARIHSIFHDVKISNISDYVQSIKDHPGDLGQFLGLSDTFTEKYNLLNIKKQPAILNKSISFPEISATAYPSFQLPTVWDCSTCGDKTLVLIGDSQLDAISFYFSPSFKRVIFISQHISHDDTYKIIAAKKPDVVLEERTERNVGALLYNLPHVK